MYTNYWENPCLYVHIRALYAGRCLCASLAPCLCCCVLSQQTSTCSLKSVLSLTLARSHRAADRVCCHSVEGKHRAHCHDYYFNPVEAAEAEATSQSRVTGAVNATPGMRLQSNTHRFQLKCGLPGYIYSYNDLCDICCYARRCFKRHSWG